MTLTDALSFQVKQPGLRWNGGGRTGKAQMLLSIMSRGSNEFKGQDVLIGKILFLLHWISWWSSREINIFFALCVFS